MTWKSPQKVSDESFYPVSCLIATLVGFHFLHYLATLNLIVYLDCVHKIWPGCKCIGSAVRIICWTTFMLFISTVKWFALSQNHELTHTKPKCCWTQPDNILPGAGQWKGWMAKVKVSVCSPVGILLAVSLSCRKMNDWPLSVFRASL